MISDLFRLEKGEPAALGTLIQLAGRMPEATRALWETRFSHVHGDLGGQRRVDREALLSSVGIPSSTASITDVIFGVQTFFVWLADVLAVAVLEKEPQRFLESRSTLQKGDLRRFLGALSSGVELEEHGVFGARSAFDFDWYVQVASDDELDGFRDIFRQLAEKWSHVQSALSSPDPLSALYSSLLPKNLLHVLGEVYTPAWLAETLLLDSGWSPGSKLIDPFAGSGVFGLAAMRIGTQNGISARSILANLCLVDLNPYACAAARSNLVIALSRIASAEIGRAPLHLPVLSADSLASALLHPSWGETRELLADPPRVAVDGEIVSLPLSSDGSIDRSVIRSALSRYGVDLAGWLGDASREARPEEEGEGSTRDRRFWEQMAVLCLSPADFLATNPPWVGWEYMSRPYRAYLDPAWKAYQLFTARGRDASFLKEDLSTLALTVGWDRYLRTGGESVAVLRMNTMTSTLAAKGLRRLSVFPDHTHLELLGVRVFDGLKVFPSAQVDAATWHIRKGGETEFPVRGLEMGRRRAKWQPRADAWLADVREELTERSVAVERVVDTDLGSRWIVGEPSCVASARALTGTTPYVGRTGVFTGGANAVYYVAPDDEGSDDDVGWYRNVTERAKRGAPSVRMRLERELVYEVIRGRDVERWRSVGGAKLLCPHTKETRMNAIAPERLEAKFPNAWSYLSEMRPVLDKRKGFTAWEKSFQEEAFYAIQRIGEYTFAPYKVVWRYIASDFIVAVAGPDADGKPQLPNDKVIFVGFDDPREAYYLAGVLSSDPIRWKVVAYASTTQISANAIESLRIAAFDAANPRHQMIAEHAESGHAAVAADKLTVARKDLEAVNHGIQQMLDLDSGAMEAFRRELRLRYPTDWTLAG